MSGSAVASSKLNVVTRQAPSYPASADPISVTGILDQSGNSYAPQAKSGQALPSLSVAKLALVGLGGWAVVAVIGYGIYHLF